MVLGRNHGMRTGPIGHPQASAQVVRIGDAIEHQQQRRLVTGQAVQQIVQRSHLGQRLDPRDHALVAMVATQLGQAQAVGLDQSNIRLFGALDELAHARIAAGRLEIDFDDGGGRRLEAHADGVKAVQHFGGRGHPGIIAAPDARLRASGSGHNAPPGPGRG